MKNYKELDKINTKIAIDHLHELFANLNRDFFNNELPEPALLLQTRGRANDVLGWCSRGKIWSNDKTGEARYELTIVAEAFNRGKEKIIATMLHEMIHLYCNEHDIKDTSRNGNYHNKTFKKIAEQHGLNIEYHDKVGWSVTELQPATKSIIKNYNSDEKIFGLVREQLVEVEKEKKESHLKKYVCPECGTAIRTSKAVNILCLDCDVKFEEEIKEEEVELAEFLCGECGVISNVNVREPICPECGSINMTKLEKYEEECMQEHALEYEETALDDGAGNMIAVEQVKIKNSNLE